jgi:hypothetical protein
LFEKHGVDVVFAGHDHNYQRTWPVVVDPDSGEIVRNDQRGVVHITTGGGGSGLSDRSVDPIPSWHTGVFHKRHHFVLIQLDETSMSITAIADGDINTPRVTERQGVGGPAEVLDHVKLMKKR